MKIARRVASVYIDKKSALEDNLLIIASCGGNPSLNFRCINGRLFFIFRIIKYMSCNSQESSKTARFESSCKSVWSKVLAFARMSFRINSVRIKNGSRSLRCLKDIIKKGVKDGTLACRSLHRRFRAPPWKVSLEYVCRVCISTRRHFSQESHFSHVT